MGAYGDRRSAAGHLDNGGAEYVNDVELDGVSGPVGSPVQLSANEVATGVDELMADSRPKLAVPRYCAIRGVRHQTCLCKI